ncbi:hypothetical protein M1L60_02670 [Actinoplanes sp. TRM 88003]|uniref:Uncharacterized protein n=1 Tax=Paractinoplanes aksuensis TaxID=2939490 RepID=A0ABT1DF90_9ACTN|nr:hypothetical protein [Actinoplanes aksuensis]MCO8269491.1 hypothetical protein [Actinoplanes aksuensis]
MDIEQERLLLLARQLREAAAAAGRTDVVAQVDEVILLLAGAQPQAGESKGNVVLRILDGLGF